MKIHHLRNATLIIESQDKFIIVDPMLGPKASRAPLAFFRFKPRKNPLVDLPANTDELLEKVTHCLITHLHPDHLDGTGINFLRKRKVPVVCSVVDQKKLEKKGLKIDISLDYGESNGYLSGKIVGVKAIHGYGFVTKIAGQVMGFHLDLNEGSSVYISSDTVYTNDVHSALTSLKPDVTIFAAGMAQLDIGKLLLMDKSDIIRFIQNSPGNVMANHMEALNHCPNTRADLRKLLSENDLLEKVDIPADGETFEY